MSYVIVPGSRADFELEVRDATDTLVDAFAVTYRLLDATGVQQVAGSGEWESRGVYLIDPDVPSSAAIGDSWFLEVTIKVTATGRTEIVGVPVEVRSGPL